MARLVTLCTGNAARSVMAGVMLEVAGDQAGRPLQVVTTGTHVVEGQPMSIRTRAALLAQGLPVPRHRSRQLDRAHLEEADLVVAMAAEHVRYVRRHHPTAAPVTATLRYLADRLAPGPASLAERVRALDLAAVDPAGQGDVADPAGGEEPDYVACAAELAALVHRLAPSLLG